MAATTEAAVEWLENSAFRVNRSAAPVSRTTPFCSSIPLPRSSSLPWRPRTSSFVGACPFGIGSRSLHIHYDHVRFGSCVICVVLAPTHEIASGLIQRNSGSHAGYVAGAIAPGDLKGG
jgi:hypothetical protein